MYYFAWIICAIDILLAFVIALPCYLTAGFIAPSIAKGSSNEYGIFLAELFYWTVLTIPLVALVSGILAPWLHKKNRWLALVGLVPFFEIGLIALLVFCLAK